MKGSISMSELSIEAKRAGEGIAYLKVTGSLDATTYEKMEKQIEALFAHSFYKLMIDLQGVHYISSAGAGVFIAAIGNAQDHNGNMILIKPSNQVQDVFEILGLKEIFGFAETMEEAQALLK